VIITSATIDAERFSQHFSGAPVIEVSGRLYPVDVRYRPVADLEKEDDERDLYDAIVDAADELARLGPGDMLVFLPGEREIREAAEALRKHALARPGMSAACTEILPLFSRLSAGEQDRIFKPSGGAAHRAGDQRRRNLAHRAGHPLRDRHRAGAGQALLLPQQGRAVADREDLAGGGAAAGRALRPGGGRRLHPPVRRAGFQRPPAVHRSGNPAFVAGRRHPAHEVAALTDVESFPFIEPPPAKAISDGYALLQELGAVDDDNALTRSARAGPLPLDPRIGRMLVAARDLGCLKEVLVIAAGFRCRTRANGRRSAAGGRRKAQVVRRREVGIPLLGEAVGLVQNASSTRNRTSKLIDNCHAHFLSYLRLREWREVHSQLHAMVAELGQGWGWKENEIPPAHYDAIHQALLSGLLGNIGCKSDESGYYLGARGIRYLIHPSSPLQKKAGKWIMAAEITETTRLFGRCVARIEPDWLEKVGAHLIKRSYFDAHWEKKAMQVAGWERTTLYGVVINPKRRIHYGPLAPAESREIFIRQGWSAKKSTRLLPSAGPSSSTTRS
jgi:ATP-dependent helicase HrpA